MQSSQRSPDIQPRRGHVPHISITDDDHHVTEAIGSYYDDEPIPGVDADPRPLSFVPSDEDSFQRKSRRNGSFFDMKQASPQRMPPGRTISDEKVPSRTEGGSGSPKSLTRMSSLGSEHSHGNSPTTPPSMSRQASNDTAIQQFPLNDIDYESSPAAVAQELSNLQAIRRMSMNVDTADPDLPSFGGVPRPAHNGSDDENDAARLFWVPARLHPELAPKEFKTFVEERVEKIKRRSGDADSLSPDGLDRSGSGSSLRRKKSMLSHQVDPTKGNYEDGAERLERKRSKGMAVEGQTQVDLQELEELVNDPAQLMRRMSIDNARRSSESGGEVSPNEDIPMLPPGAQSLKRSTRTTYRRGSLKKGERVPFSKRAQMRATEPETEESLTQPPSSHVAEEPILGLTRVQTEPIPPPTDGRQTYPSRTDSSLRWREKLAQSKSGENLSAEPLQDDNQTSPRPSTEEEQQPRPQQRHFQSRLASGGRTTAQLPGYNNPNPLPNIIETLPDGTKVPVANANQSHPDRKKSHEHQRPFQRGGAHMRPAPGARDHQRSSTLDDISAHPSPLPGSGNTSTDALTMVPTFEERKSDKKDSSKKSSWKWILGNDGDEKEKKSKEDQNSDSASVRSSKSSKLTKVPGEKARLDVLQNSIDGNVPARGRESLVLNREDVKLEEERKKESKKSSESRKEKDSGLLSAIFGGKKKASDGDLKEKKRKSDRNLSPDPVPKILKPDIDYNWTRFSILEERAIYRMAHIKLANPRRALYSQVLLSNFMYSYLAKVQMMHPQVQIPPAHQKSQQRGKQEEQQKQPQQQPAEYNQYQRWQQQQEREAAANSGPANAQQSLETPQQRTSYDYDDDSSTGYDPRSSEEYEYDHSYQTQSTPHRTNGAGITGGGGGGGGRQGGYSVAGSHDYLGYPRDTQPFDSKGLWDDDEKSEDLW